MNHLPISKDRLVTLYSSGRSMSEIAQILQCSPHKIVYWMSKYSITRRSISEALYSKLNPDGDPFFLKNLVTKNDWYLYGLGLGIYWGEGEKASRNAIRVANSDPYVLLTFSRFLQLICGVKQAKMRFSIICFNDSNPDEVKRYWSRMLKISDAKFGKIVVIPTQGKGIYKKKSLFGVCTLTVSNTKLKIWIMEEITKIREQADIV